MLAPRGGGGDGRGDGRQAALNILFVGDVVGRPGRRAAQLLIPELRRKHEADFVVVNAENAAAGYGVTASTARELFEAGADCLTTGNHVWAQKEAGDVLTGDPRILRPANYPPGAPGAGAGVFRSASGATLGVINLLGRIFMEPMDCPFRAAAAELAGLRERCDAVIVDMHAEATSEKAALAYYLDGQVTAVIGTHTHVQTADEQVLPGGTGFLSDCGMTGPVGTIIGVRTEIVLRRFLTGMPARFDVPKGGPAMLNGVVVQTSRGGLICTGLERIRVLTDGGDES
jgi:2',3'-cyclic-nucleotide 2'-phosphodiesterase